MHSETSVMVKRPVETVWALLTEPSNLPRWSDAWLGARLTSPPPIRRGTTFQGRRAILGVDVRWRGQVTEWDPPHTLAYSVEVLGARSEGRVTLEATADGTKVVRVSGREPRPAQKLASWILGPWLSRHHDARNRRLHLLLKD
jgi:uncharacterized protein YndB with AHSA1/START domain